MSHRIDDVSFPPGQPGDRGSIVCTCGSKVTVADWEAHRKAFGAKARKLHELEVGLPLFGEADRRNKWTLGRRKAA